MVCGSNLLSLELFSEGQESHGNSACGLASWGLVVWESASPCAASQVTKAEKLSDQCVPVVSGAFCAQPHILYQILLSNTNISFTLFTLQHFWLLVFLKRFACLYFKH